MKKTERGWCGHFCCGERCRYRRNTLLEHDDRRVIVSSVGSFIVKPDDKWITNIGCGNGSGRYRYYETMVFEAQREGAYWEVDASKELDFYAPDFVCANHAKELPKGVDVLMDQHHDSIVRKWMRIMRRGGK